MMSQAMGWRGEGVYIKNLKIYLSEHASGAHPAFFEGKGYDVEEGKSYGHFL